MQQHSSKPAERRARTRWAGGVEAPHIHCRGTVPTFPCAPKLTARVPKVKKLPDNRRGPAHIWGRAHGGDPPPGASRLPPFPPFLFSALLQAAGWRRVLSRGKLLGTSGRGGRPGLAASRLPHTGACGRASDSHCK